MFSELKFSQGYKIIEITVNSLCYLFSVHIFEERSLEKTVNSKMKADCNSLGECRIVFRLNCKHANEIYAA